MKTIIFISDHEHLLDDAKASDLVENYFDSQIGIEDRLQATIDMFGSLFDLLLARGAISPEDVLALTGNRYGWSFKEVDI